MSNLMPIKNDDGLEFHVDTETNLVYASVKATERMLGTGDGTIRKFLRSQPAENYTTKMAEIHTPDGLRQGKLLSADQVFKLALKYNVALAEKMGACGANVFLLGLSGFKVEAVQSAPPVPQTYLEALKALVVKTEAEELLKLQLEAAEEDNTRQAEIIDELFDYSSIIRIAKYNTCSETAFEWRKLVSASKVMNLEVKTAPCPRFVTKNLYHHDAWRLAYPGYRMPETTTLTIVSPPLDTLPPLG